MPLKFKKSDLFRKLTEKQKLPEVFKVEIPALEDVKFPEKMIVEIPGVAMLKGDKGDKGDPGKDGKTPIKFLDYHDGKDGKDGKNGKDGKTPIKGVDYFDGKDGKDGRDGKDGKDGKDCASRPIVKSHSNMTGLLNDDHSQYALLAGRSGGQTLIGGSSVTDTLKIQGTSGNGTLTSPAVQVLVGNNGATVAMTVLNNGYVGFGTASPGMPFHVAGLARFDTSVGIGANPSSAYGVYCYKVNTGQATYIGLSFDVYHQNTGGYGCGILGNAYGYPATGTTIGYNRGAWIRAYNYSSTDGILTNNFGMQITTGVYRASTSAIIASNIGIMIDSATVNTNGVITNNYGIYIASQTVGTTKNYAIYTNAGFCVFGDKVGIGITTPTALLHIKAGTATADTAPLKFTAGVNNTVPVAGCMEYDNNFHLTISDSVRRSIVLAPNATKVVAGAPYANDGYVVMNILGTDFKMMTTA